MLLSSICVYISLERFLGKIYNIRIFFRNNTLDKINNSPPRNRPRISPKWSKSKTFRKNILGENSWPVSGRKAIYFVHCSFPWKVHHLEKGFIFALLSSRHIKIYRITVLGFSCHHLKLYQDQHQDYKTKTVEKCKLWSVFTCINMQLTLKTMHRKAWFTSSSQSGFKMSYLYRSDALVLQGKIEKKVLGNIGIIFINRFFSILVE